MNQLLNLVSSVLTFNSRVFIVVFVRFETRHDTVCFNKVVCVFSVVEKKAAAVQRCEEQLLRMEVQATDREENKQIALSTSKLNYLDPRISVAW